MAIELFGNAAGTTVGAGGIDASATSLLVTSSAAPFPQTGNFRLVIDSEILLATAVPDGTHFTVTRGAEGTTAAAHAAGAAVTQIVTAGALTQFGADQVQTGADASLPSAARKGMLYLPNDSVTPYVHDGATWRSFGLLAPLHTPPVAGDWTALNSPPALTSYHGGLLLPGTALAGDNIKGYYRAAPATPYVIDVGFTISVPIFAWWQGGVIWYDTVSGKLTTTSPLMVQNDDNVPTWFWISNKFNSVTSFNVGYNYAHGNPNLGYHCGFPGIHWVRFSDDGTNRKVSLSPNGLDWVVVLTVGRTDWQTPNKVGFFVNSVNTAFAGSLRLLSWYEH